MYVHFLEVFTLHIFCELRTKAECVTENITVDFWALISDIYYL